MPAGGEWDPFPEFKEETIKFNFRLKIVTSNEYQAMKLSPSPRNEYRKIHLTVSKGLRKSNDIIASGLLSALMASISFSSLCCSSLISANYWINSFLHRIFKESCFISFLLYNRYDSSFWIFPGQNVCRKVKKVKRNWTGPGNFDIFLCVLFDHYYQN